MHEGYMVVGWWEGRKGLRDWEKVEIPIVDIIGILFVPNKERNIKYCSVLSSMPIEDEGNCVCGETTFSLKDLISAVSKNLVEVEILSPEFKTYRLFLAPELLHKKVVDFDGEVVEFRGVVKGGWEEVKEDTFDF